MIDAHTHILPAMDDGARDAQISEQMIECELQSGVSLIAATPHFYPSIMTPSEFLARRDESAERIKDHKDHVLLGAEVQYYDGICRMDGIERLCIEGTKLFLLELPFVAWDSRVIDNVSSLCEREEIILVLAHIDRYFKIQKAPMIEKIMETGALLQFNAEAFLNPFSRKKAIAMFEDGLCAMLGSDAHNMSSRKPNLAKAKEIIVSKTSKEIFEKYERKESEIFGINN